MIRESRHQHKELNVRWQGRNQSDNIEDRRGMRGGPMVVGGGIGTLLIVLLVMFLGGDPRALLDQMQQPQQQGPIEPGGEGEVELSPAEKQITDFVSVTLKSTEDVWNRLFAEMGRTYREPKLVLFRGQVQSACGFASAAVGPFYCPADEKVYLDTSFFNDLDQKLGAPGDFAQAYVIAHEIGHHVQKILGVSDKVAQMRGQMSATDYNRLSVRVELQADFYAGVWAHHAQKESHILEPGDIEEGLRAATAIGDDRLQRESAGRVVPDSFTHGTSEQRVRWFRKGLETGDVRQGNTFEAEEL